MFQSLVKKACFRLRLKAGNIWREKKQHVNRARIRYLKMIIARFIYIKIALRRSYMKWVSSGGLSRTFDDESVTLIQSCLRRRRARKLVLYKRNIRMAGVSKRERNEWLNRRMMLLRINPHEKELVKGFCFICAEQERVQSEYQNEVNTYNYTYMKHIVVLHYNAI